MKTKLVRVKRKLRSTECIVFSLRKSKPFGYNSGSVLGIVRIKLRSHQLKSIKLKKVTAFKTKCADVKIAVTLQKISETRRKFDLCPLLATNFEMIVSLFAAFPHYPRDDPSLSGLAFEAPAPLSPPRVASVRCARDLLARTSGRCHCQEERRAD